MAGQGCLYRRGGSFAIPHFTDHNNIRVQSKKAAHNPGKVESDFRPHLYLAQSCLGDFHRIFGSPDFNPRFVDMAQGGMQSGRLSGAGGTDA